MDLAEMGQAYQFLLRYRVVESKPLNRKRLHQGESEIVSILRSADIDGIALFNEFLNSQGMQIREYNDTDYNSIPVGGQIWVLIRDTESNPPEYMTIKRIHESMKLREKETHETSNIWFLHIWLIYLSLIYTRPGRGISQVSEFTNAMFLEKQLIEAVQEHIEQVRRMGISSGATQKVIKVLDAEKGNDIPRRIRNFLSLMCDSGLISKIGEDEFQQTILGAVEMAESFNRSMRHYIIPDDEVLNNIVNTIAPESKGENQKEDINVSD